MDNDLAKKVNELNQKVEELSDSIGKIKTYFKWALIISLALFIVPLLGLLFAIPSYINTLNTITNL